MPSYDFICQDCQHSFTANLSISKRRDAVCEKCGSSKLEQLFRKCNVLGGKGGGTSGCSHTGGCSNCSGC